MKKYILLVITVFLWSCESQNFNNNNPYIPNYSFSTELNLELPSYSALNFVSNAKYLSGFGARGIIVFNAGNNNFKAYDAACPNQALSSCSTMAINGINVVCACDNNSYNLFSGQSTGQYYPMKQYRVEIFGTIIRVYN
jgi:nitrite reductase/ring-hydroxylating ferredoxin subunit